MAASKTERLVAEALCRVVLRNMFAGRSLAYERLLAETSAEVDVLLDKRRERDARLLRRARKQVLEDQVRLAAAAESDVISAVVAEATSELKDLLVRQQETFTAKLAEQERLIAFIITGESDPASAPPIWHPDHRLNPENDL